MPDLAAPQLVVHSRMLCLSWLPADPAAVGALLPAGLQPMADRQVFMNQYVVDDDTQTSGFGAHSSTFLGVGLAGTTTPDGRAVDGWWTHYLVSSERVQRYVGVRGTPAAPGRTTIEVRGGTLVAVTAADGVPLIRVQARVGQTGHTIASGQYRYFTGPAEQMISGFYPYVAEPVAPFEIESVEFLASAHPVYALRPSNPLTLRGGFHSPRASFAYPGGERVTRPEASSCCAS